MFNINVYGCNFPSSKDKPVKNGFLTIRVIRVHIFWAQAVHLDYQLMKLHQWTSSLIAYSQVWPKSGSFWSLGILQTYILFEVASAFVNNNN